MKITTTAIPEHNTIHFIISNPKTNKSVDRLDIYSMEDSLQDLFGDEITVQICSDKAIKERFALSESSLDKGDYETLLKCAVSLSLLDKTKSLDVQLAHAFEHNDVMASFDRELWLYGARNSQELTLLKNENIKIAVQAERMLKLRKLHNARNSGAMHFVKADQEQVIDANVQDFLREIDPASYTSYYMRMMSKPKLSK